MIKKSTNKILIVDDNLQNLALMKMALKYENIEIHTAKSGESVLEKIQKNTFGLIIMDINLPRLTGFETVEIINKSQVANKTPIIFITSQHLTITDINRGFNMGAYDYIMRPVNTTLFKNKVKTFLRLFQVEQQLKKTNNLLAQQTKQLNQQLNQQKQLNTDLQFSEQVFENSVTGIIVVDENLKFIRANKAFTEITGYSIKELKGKTPKILSSGLQDKAFYEEMWATLIEKGAWQGELWNKRKNSELYAEMLSINAVKSSDGSVKNYIGIVSDITKKKLAYEKTEYLAHFDYLTNLPNRLYLMTHLKGYIANKEIHSLVIIFLDLDKFKPINDQYGHQTGDDVLIAVAKRLKDCVRNTDLVARLGGDEFIIVLKNPKDALKTSKKIATHLISSISSAFNLSGIEIHINTSIGISLYPQHGTTADALITLADKAMYQSKSKGSGYFHFC